MATVSSFNRGNARTSRNVATNILGAIPMTDQTDPRKFDGYEFIEYPKMMLQADGKPYIDTASNEPIVVLDADEERQFRDENPDTLDTGAAPSSALDAAERSELERLRKMYDSSADPTAKAESVKEAPAPNKLVEATGAQRKPSPHRTTPLKARDGAPLPKPLKD